MNPPSLNERYIHIETVLTHKNRNDSTPLYQSPYYDVNIKAWLTLGGETPIRQAEDKPLCDYPQKR